MGRFYPLYLRRSDGQAEVTNHHKRKEPNEPTKEQLDATPDANGTSDYYREIPIDEPKHLDWRRKLGGMLARDLGFSDNEKGYMLAAFPENYRLYEHVKTSGSKAGVKTTKTHAGGGNDRQDAYLYGHPLGRKKRFRSPADFYAHLYWLATDESGDPDNCACKICTPEEFEEPKVVVLKKEVKQEPVKQPAKEPEAPKKVPVVVIPPRPAELQPNRSTATPQPQPTAIPAIRNDDQAADLTYSAWIFRTGELVWFSKGMAWGLGIITRRWKERSASGDVVSKYNVQPLSHPYGHPPQATVTGNERLRPWLAWSVPGFTHEGLNKISVTYDTADWNAMLQHKYGSGDLEVDGSILAAKATDSTYTTFDLISRRESQPGTTELHWNGIYLGAEKIWIGDVVRIRPAMDLLIVRDIVERSKTSPSNQQVLEHSVLIIGDVYTISIQHNTNPSQPFPAGTDLSALPNRLFEDLQHRNKRTSATKGTISVPRLTRATAQLSTRDIKGRWYEATLLHPVLNPQGWTTEFQNGDIIETGARMNSRGDCNTTPTSRERPPAEVRRPDRKDAFGKAVPATLIIEGNGSQGLGQAQALGAGQAQRTQQSSPQAEAGDVGHGLDEFMNLDGMDGQGFGAHYGAGDY
ncbi:hypothetical protein MBLNU457_1168t1 [Dothideomycetes sp. NU457]